MTDVFRIEMAGRRPILAATVMLGLAAGEASAQVDQGLLPGVWDCAAGADGAAVAMEVRYEDDGEMELTFGVVGTDDSGTPFDMQGQARGRWTIEGGDLLEVIESTDITALEIDGQAIPLEMVPADQAAAIMGGESVSAIVELDAERLLLREPDGQELACERMG